MNAREKKLLLFLIVAVVAGGLLTGTNRYLDHLDSLRGDLETAEQDRNTFDADTLAADIFSEMIDDYELMSLGSDQNHALASYKSWLINLLETELGLEDVRITNEPSREVENQYFRHTFGINCESDLKTLTEFLYQFETKRILHRIKDLAVSPKGYDQLQVRIVIEAISLPGANSQIDITKIEHDASLVNATKEEYWERISNRNFFGPENKTPTFTPPPIATTVGRSETRTLTASAGANEQNLQSVTYDLDVDSVPSNFVATLNGNRLTVSSDEVGRYEFNVKVTDNGLPAKTITKKMAVTVSEKPEPKPPTKRPDPPKPPIFNVAQLAFFTSTVQVNDRVEVWIHRRDLGEILKLPIGANVEIGTIKGKIHGVNQRYLTILTAENELLEIRAGKALSTAVNVTAQAESLLLP
ncbi:MAG: hypothetical protein CMJ76_01635 [Planctomycetaceae bacterium]|nr:hypothetical protein [Planctomycetaceae bacterium]